jgi:hypothetical protein
MTEVVKCKWTDERLTILLNELINEHRSGTGTSSGFKSASWARITINFNRRRTCLIKKTSCRVSMLSWRRSTRYLNNFGVQVGLAGMTPPKLWLHLTQCGTHTLPATKVSYTRPSRYKHNICCCSIVEAKQFRRNPLPHVEMMESLQEASHLLHMK